MSVTLMSLIFAKSKTKGNARLVLLAIADSASDEGYCWPSLDTIAKKCNLSRQITREYVRAFKKIGVIEVEKRTIKNTEVQTSNGYWFKKDMIGMDEIDAELMNECRPKSRLTRNKRRNDSPPGLREAGYLGGQGEAGYPAESSYVEPSSLNHHKAERISSASTPAPPPPATQSPALNSTAPAHHSSPAPQKQHSSPRQGNTPSPAQEKMEDKSLKRKLPVPQGFFLKKEEGEQDEEDREPTEEEIAAAREKREAEARRKADDLHYLLHGNED